MFYQVSTIFYYKPLTLILNIKNSLSLSPSRCRPENHPTLPATNMAAQSLRFSLSLLSPTPTTKQFQPNGITPKPYLRISKPIKYSPIRSEISATSTTPLVSNGALVLKPSIGDVEIVPVIEIDRVVESDLKENGFRGTRKTKIVCTIGPATCGFDELETLAEGGMNVARLNMCHGTHEWHKSVIERIRRLNVEKGFGVSIMMDTQGSEIHMGDLGGASSAKVEDGDVWTFTVRSYESELPERTVSVNYDGFAEDVYIGDELIVDGGMARFEVIQKIGPDVKCLCTDPGLLLPRANLTFWRDGRLVQERNAMLPTISAKDWLDIDFGISEGVDFIAVSFVKSAEVINHLKKYLAAHPHDSGTYVISKIENVDSLKNLDTIIKASDGVMVARGDLGAQIPLEQVPSVQKKIVEMCRELNKPVIVASQLLESMIEYPIPTRAEVADVTEVIRQQADAIMLSGESAMGQYPFKALSVLRSISLRIEKWWREENCHRPRKLPIATFTSPNIVTNELCTAAASMANKLGADALFVYTKSGYMASLLSQCRPDCPIFAFTPSLSARRRMNLQWGLVPFCLNFPEDDDNTLNKTFAFLKARGMIKPGDKIISVSDKLQSIQVVNVPRE